MDKIYIEIANRISFVMQTEKVAFDVAFADVMQNYRHLDWGTTRKKVGSNLGKRKKHRRAKKITGQQMDFFFGGMTKKEAERDAARHEASLIAGIPTHDL